MGARQRDAELTALVNEINRKLKRDVVVRGRDLIYQEIPRITSGSLALDAMLGGGFPANQWNEIIGDESSGKTTVVMNVIAANQATVDDYVAVWIAAEDFVAPWAETNGMDLSRLILAETSNMEEAFEVVDMTLASKVIDCLVVDSLPALVPTEEAEKTFNDWQVGLAARLTGKMFRRSTASGKRALDMTERTWTGFVINQWRDKIGVLYGDPRTTPGGKGKNYFYFTRVETRRDGWLTIDGKSASERVGLTIAARTIKNKTFPPARTATVDFYFKEAGEHEAGKYDTAGEVVNLAMALEVVQKTGNTYHFNGEKVGVGREKVMAAISADPKLLRMVWDATLECIVTPYIPVAPKPATHRAKPRARLVRKT